MRVATWTDDLDERGWTAFSVLGAARAGAIATMLDQLLAGLGPADRRTGDKPFADTRRLASLDERAPELLAELTDLPAVRDAIGYLVGDGAGLVEATYRCPGPGGGGQRLHADDVPKLDDGPTRVATAIVALVHVDESNGATRVVPGSHRRPDLQRHAGTLDAHPDEVSLSGPAGTMFVFSGHLLHSGTPNRSATPRPAIQLSWRRRQAGGQPWAMATA